MSLLRMDNVGIVVEDLEATIAFFVELGLIVDARMPVEGAWVDRVVGLDDVQCDIVMMRTPDGHSKLEIMRFRQPKAVPVTPKAAPANALGLRRLMFAVEDLDDTVKRLQALGGTVVRELVQYEDKYRLCYLRGPEGLLFGIAEPL